MAAKRIEGMFTGWTTNDRGHVHGFTLDGTVEVRFPPHEADLVVPRVKDGDVLVVHGHEHAPPHERAHVDAELIETKETAIDIDSGPRRPGSRPIPPPRGLTSREGTPGLEERLASIEQVLAQLVKRLPGETTGS